MIVSTDGVSPSSAMPNYMDQYGDRLTANGYPVIPVWPGAKCPGRFSSTRGWEGYRDWTRHCDRLSSMFEMGVWRRWPGCAVGVACGKVGAFDIDILDEGLAMEIEARARAELGDTPAVRIGQAPKRLLVYRLDKPFRPVKRHPLEFLAHGNQFVAYAIHPETGLPYSWPHEGLDEVDASRLPVVSEERVLRFMDAAYALVPPELRQGRIRQDRGKELYWNRDGDKLGTPEAVAAALDWLPNDDIHYDDWVAVMLAAKMAVGEAGRDAWLRWSAKSAKDVPAYSIRQWSAARPNGSLGAGTIYRAAMSHGWVPPTGMTLNGTPRPEVTFTGRLGAVVNGGNVLRGGRIGREEEGTEERSEPEKSPSVPAEVMRPGGILECMVDWMVQTAKSPQPFLALGASICALGALMGQKYRLEHPDTRSGVYIIAVADSGGGKDHPRAMVKKAFRAAGLGDFMAEEPASGAGLLAGLYRHNCRVYLIDEFGQFVQAVMNPRSTSSHRRDIMTRLTTLWSSTTGVMLGVERAELRHDDGRREDIDQPCACVYGSTVPAPFWAAFQSGNVADGSLARFLLFESEDSYPDRNEVLEDPDDRLEEIAACLRRIVVGPKGDPDDPVSLASAIGAVRQPFVDVPGGRRQPGVKPSPRPETVPLDEAAAEEDRAVADEDLVLKRAHAGKATSSIVARFHEHVRRLALIAAVSDDAAEPVVRAKHVAWAAATVRHCMARMLDGVERFVADTEHEARLKRVLDVIRRHRGWMDGNTLARKTQFLSRRDRNEVITQLEESGLIELSQEPTATKPRRLVRATP